MRLIHFKSKGLHGFLDFDFSFDHRLTFLTGINGSGKTTVLNSIYSLIAPSLSILGTLNFSALALTVESTDGIYTISARRSETNVSLSVSGIEGIFRFNVYEPTLSDTPAEIDTQEEYYGKIISSHETHPVVRFIRNIPTPMFLGIDRRAKQFARRRRRLIRTSVVSRNIFTPSPSWLMDASYLAEDSYRDTLIEVAAIEEDLRKNLFLTLIEMSPSENFGTFDVPKRVDMHAISRARQQLKALPHILHVPEDKIMPRIQPFIDLLENNAKKIPPDLNPSDILSSKNADREMADALLSWNINKPRLKRIQEITKLVEQFNQKKDGLLQASNNYIELLNGFFNDSRKYVSFNGKGYLEFYVRDNPEPQDTRCLSSGEGQIFAILTHLSFNTEALQANVFLIDEPELSLHVQWQESFVDSILQSNEGVQFILATHSPSIILEKSENCVELDARL